MTLSRRHLLRASAAVGATGLLASCGRREDAAPASTASASAAPKSEPVIDLDGAPVVALFTSLNNDYYASWDLGGQRAVQAFNGEYRAFTNEGDPARLISQFEQQVDAGAKIFFMTAPDPSPMPTIGRLAQEAGVFFTNTWEMPPWDTPFTYGDAYVSYLTADSIAAGYEVATRLFEEMGGEGNVVHITGHPGSTPDTQRTIGFDQALAENPGIQLLARTPGEWNRDDARSAMAGIITQYGDDIGGVFGQNDDVAIGVMNALNEAGLQDVPITGVDGNLGTMDFISSGGLFGSFSTLPFWSAGYSAVRAIDASLGVVAHPLERQLFTGGVFVTADNVEAYLSTFFGDTDPFDWQLMSRAGHPDDWDPQNQVVPMDLQKMWGSEPQPPGYVLPEAYTAALGEMGAVTQQFADHWKIRLP